MNVLQFLPLRERQTIGRPELRAVLRALDQVTMVTPATILSHSKYIVDGCHFHAKKWPTNHGWTTVGLVRHTDLWKVILIFVAAHAWHAVVHRVRSHGSLKQNDLVDKFAGQGRMRSLLLTVRITLLVYAWDP